MTLYLAVVLLATLAALPAGHDDAAEPVHGPVGVELIAIVWGTTIGLAVAHSFAFHVATHGFGGGRLRGQDRLEVLAEVGGAVFVAVVATLPVLVFSEDVEQQVVPFVLALTIGVVSYVVERADGRTRTASVVFAVITLLAGLVAATVKNLLSAH